MVHVVAPRFPAFERFQTEPILSQMLEALALSAERDERVVGVDISFLANKKIGITYKLGERQEKH
ncbi:hypothetical protein AB4Y40_40325 [Paraburkholderia sp. EG287B]|uniref:hypothetical protein n=1 Tax=Paraburkholderia sp. EG287B TaxID=3237010 RepID=UPI0034D1AA5B